MLLDAVKSAHIGWPSKAESSRSCRCSRNEQLDELLCKAGCLSAHNVDMQCSVRQKKNVAMSKSGHAVVKMVRVAGSDTEQATEDPS